MQLNIDGTTQTLTNIKDFRQTHAISEDFGVALFEPKYYPDMGSIDHAGEALNLVRVQMLEIIPPTIDYLELLKFVEKLSSYFRLRLNLSNDHINLKEEEISFAVDGFDTVMHQVAYAYFDSLNARQPMTDFKTIYNRWFTESVRVSQRTHEYSHQGQVWRVNVINTAYGRSGLVVNMGDETQYVYDVALACPAEGFMYTLMKAVTEKLVPAIRVMPR